MINWEGFSLLSNSKVKKDPFLKVYEGYNIIMCLSLSGFVTNAEIQAENS